MVTKQQRLKVYKNVLDKNANGFALGLCRALFTAAEDLGIALGDITSILYDFPEVLAQKPRGRNVFGFWFPWGMDANIQSHEKRLQIIQVAILTLLIP